MRLSSPLLAIVAMSLVPQAAHAGGLRCSVARTEVTVEWDPLDPSLEIFIFEFERDGRLIARHRPLDNAFTDSVAISGRYRYTVRAGQLLVGQCDVVVEDFRPLACTVDANSVTVDWSRMPLDEFGYQYFEVRRDGAAIARTPWRQYAERLLPGEHSYSVLIDGWDQVGECRVTGPGSDEDGGTSGNGDVNGDSEIDVSDAIYLLSWLFVGGPAPGNLPCAVDFECGGETVNLENGDANGDRSRDISDTMYLLDWLFGGGPPSYAICFCM